MLYVKMEGVGEYTYHVGSGGFTRNVDWVTEVQADGHELQAIQEQFPQLPMHNGRVVNWYGELARFIVGNLDL